MSKKLDEVLKEVDSLDAMGDLIKNLAKGLRKKLPHLYAGSSPSGGRKQDATSTKVVLDYRATVAKRASK